MPYKMASATTIGHRTTMSPNALPAAGVVVITVVWIGVVVITSGSTTTNKRSQ